MIDVHLFSLGWSTSICAFDFTDILHGRRYVFGVFFFHLDFLDLHIDISVHINDT